MNIDHILNTPLDELGTLVTPFTEEDDAESDKFMEQWPDGRHPSLFKMAGQLPLKKFSTLIVAVGSEILLPSQFAAVTVTVIVAPMSACTKV